MACRASHDPDGDRRYSALHCSRVGDRNFLWFYSPIPPENFAIDCCCVDFSLQQNRSCDRGDVARCNDLGNARIVSRRVPSRMLDTESAGTSTCASPPISTPRLRALACFFSSGVADVLASVRRFAVHCGPFRDSCLLRHAPPHQSRTGAAEDDVRWNGLSSTRWQQKRLGRPIFAPLAVSLPSSSEKPIHRRVCE